METDMMSEPVRRGSLLRRDRPKRCSTWSEAPAPSQRSSDRLKSQVEADLPTFLRGRYLATHQGRLRRWASTITFDRWEQMAVKRQIPERVTLGFLLRREGAVQDAGNGSEPKKLN